MWHAAPASSDHLSFINIMDWRWWNYVLLADQRQTFIHNCTGRTWERPFISLCTEPAALLPCSIIMWHKLWRLCRGTKHVFIPSLWWSALLCLHLKDLYHASSAFVKSATSTNTLLLCLWQSGVWFLFVLILIVGSLFLSIIT